VLAQSPDFVVQARQVSTAPAWPDASVNEAIGTQMGNTRVAVCLPEPPVVEPPPVPKVFSSMDSPDARLEVNGSPTTVSPDRPLVLPDGVEISRTGNAYLIRGPHGDSVRVEVNSTWIDATVGLGGPSSTVRGLLANANGNVNQVATRGGTVLTWPLSFEDLYQVYGDSWRVKPGESLMCGADRVESANPQKPFYAKDLDPQIAQPARAACQSAGVSQGALLDACTLDVAVLGPTAAQAYVGARQPTAVGTLIDEHSCADAFASDNPVVCYRLGEPVGSNQLIDSAHAHNGACVNNTTSGLPGVITPDTARGFNGTAAYCYANGIAAPKAGYTIEGWGKLSAQNAGTIAEHGGSGGVYVTTNSYCMRNAWETLCWPSTPSVGVWHHLAATWSASDATMRLYVDGVLRAGKVSGAKPSGTSTFYVGYGQSAPWFKGTIDEVAYYPAALSAGRIATHYHTGCAC